MRVTRSGAVAACVGSICAKPLAGHRVPVVEPARARLGSLVRALADALPARARPIRAGGRTLQLRGQAVLVDGHYRPVQPAPMAVLRALAAEPGTVVSRRALLAVLPGAGDEHAVETAVARLRTALGVPHLVHTVVKRGYRLAS